MAEQWDSGVLYLRVIAKKGEPPFVSKHDCWNRALFVESQRQARQKEGGSVEVITREQYEAER